MWLTLALSWNLIYGILGHWRNRTDICISESCSGQMLPITMKAVDQGSRILEDEGSGDPVRCWMLGTHLVIWNDFALPIRLATHLSLKRSPLRTVPIFRPVTWSLCMSMIRIWMGWASLQWVRSVNLSSRTRSFDRSKVAETRMRV